MSKKHGPTNLSELVGELYTLTSNPNIRVQKRIKDTNEFIEKHRKILINDFNLFLQEVDDTLKKPIDYNAIIQELAYPIKKEELNSILSGYGKVIFRYLILTKFPLELKGTQREEIIESIIRDLVPSTGCLIKRFSRSQLNSDYYLHYYELLREQCNLILELGAESQTNLLLKLENVIAKKRLNTEDVAQGNITLLKLSTLLLGYQQAVIYLPFFGEDSTKFLKQAISLAQKLFENSRNVGEKLKPPMAVLINFSQYSNIFKILDQENETCLNQKKSPCLNLFNIINDFYINSFGKDNAILEESCVGTLLENLDKLLLTMENTPENIKIQILSLIKQYNIKPIDEHRYEAASKILQLLTLVISHLNFPAKDTEKCVALTTQAIFKQIEEEIKKIPQPVQKLDESLATEFSLLNLKEKEELIQKEHLNTIIAKIEALKLEENIIEQNYKQERQVFKENFEFEHKRYEKEYQDWKIKLEQQQLQNQNDLETMRKDYELRCNNLKSQINNLKKQYEKEKKQGKAELNEQTKAYQLEQSQLTDCLNKVENDLRSLKSDYAKKLEVLQENHPKALERIKSKHQQKCINQSNQETKRLESELDKQKKANQLEQRQLTNRLNKELNELISSLNSDYAKKRRILQEEHFKALEIIKRQHQQECNTQKEQEETALDEQKKANQLEQSQLTNRLNKELNELISSPHSDYAKKFDALQDEHFKALEKIETQHQQERNNQAKVKRKAILEFPLVAILDFPSQVQCLQGILDRAGIEHYIVGGALRDYLKYLIELHSVGYTQPVIEPNALNISDYDVIVNCAPEQLPFEIKCYASLTALPNLLKLKGEINIDLFCERWNNLHTKLMKLDFTVNALICRGREVYDPLNVYEDLVNANLLVLGDAKERFEEDPVVILRMIRFAIKFGYDIQFEDHLAIQNCRHLVPNLHIDVYLNNVRKLFANHFAAQYYEGVLNLGLLHVVIPTLPWHYQSFLSGHLAMLDRFWRKKLNEIATTPENFTGHDVLTLFLLMQLLIRGDFKEVINDFLKEFSSISEDKKRMRCSIKALMFGDNNACGIYQQYRHFESTIKKEKRLAPQREYTPRIDYQRKYTPSYGQQTRPRNNETRLEQKRKRLN